MENKAHFLFVRLYPQVYTRGISLTRNKRSGFTLIELMIAGTLLVGLIGMFFILLRFGILSSNKGMISGQTRENARTAMDRLLSELRQAVPLPAGQAGSLPGGSGMPPAAQTVALPSAVILPGAGGTIENADDASVGCSSPPCVNLSTYVSTLDPLIEVPHTSDEVEQSASTCGPAHNLSCPSGFVIFSELKQQINPTTEALYVPGDQGYRANPENYVWVMLQDVAPKGAVFPELVRYTFTAVDSGGNLRGLTFSNNRWQRDDAYFVPANAINSGSPVLLASLFSPQDEWWFMVSHGAPSISGESLATGLPAFDPRLLNITVTAAQASIQSQQQHGPLTKTTLSSQVEIQGSVP